MKNAMMWLVPGVLLVSSLASAATKNPPALPMKAPSVRAQILANAKASSFWAKLDTPKLNTRRTNQTTVATVSGLVPGGVAGGTAKFHDPIRRATFNISVSDNGEIAKRKGAWKDIQIHRM